MQPSLLMHHTLHRWLSSSLYLLEDSLGLNCFGKVLSIQSPFLVRSQSELRGFSQRCSSATVSEGRGHICFYHHENTRRIVDRLLPSKPRIGEMCN